MGQGGWWHAASNGMNYMRWRFQISDLSRCVRFAGFYLRVEWCRIRDFAKGASKMKSELTRDQLERSWNFIVWWKYEQNMRHCNWWFYLIHSQNLRISIRADDWHWVRMHIQYKYTYKVDLIRPYLFSNVSQHYQSLYIISTTHTSISNTVTGLFKHRRTSNN